MNSSEINNALKTLFTLAEFPSQENFKPFEDTIIPSNYSFVLYLPQEIQDQVENIQDKIKAINPKHYFVPQNQLHMTILGGFLEPSKFKQIGETSKSLPDKLKFQFMSLMPNRATLALYAFPTSFNLKELRAKLDKTFGPTPHSRAYSEVHPFICWTNVVWWQSLHTNEEKTYIKGLLKKDLGSVDISEVSLIKLNSRVAAPSRTELIQQIDLTS